METWQDFAELFSSPRGALAHSVFLPLCAFLAGGLVVWIFHQTKLAFSNDNSAILEAEVRAARERAILEWELAATQDYLQSTVLPERLATLLKWLMPHPETGFSAVFRLVKDVPRLASSVGLDPESRHRLQLSADLLQDTLSTGVGDVFARDQFRNRSLTGLTNHDRSKLVSPFVLRLGSARKPWGIVVCSHEPAILPHPAHDAFRLPFRELVAWATPLGSELAILESIAHQDSELTLTQEMLELRAMADQQYRSPSHMLQRFISRLSELVQFERAVIFLFEQDDVARPIPLVRGGIPLSQDLMDAWQLGEELLSIEMTGMTSSSSWGVKELRRLNILDSFHNALLLPLVHGQWVMGQLCLTRRTGESIDDGDRRLLLWGTGFLVELLTRTVDRVTMEQQATRDGLTQLANRRTFDLELDRTIDRANRTGDDCALVLLDLDHFKKVNDTYGHLGGDAALRTVAHVVQRSVQAMRDDDNPVVARYGGEELVILLPGVGAQGAHRIAESIREAVERTPISFEQGTFHITLSAGVAARGTAATSSRGIIASADQALYRAKEQGRNRVELNHAEERPPQTASVLT
ncbi:MAG: GGDEF domain-containing protein [Planctomycetota bacterium]|nr:MAG: GGDEF domain-containing protein [Planctomycetota bacterium]